MKCVSTIIIGALVLIKVTLASRSKLLDESSPLIVGGSNAQKGKYPWQALLYYNDRFRCGGTLIKDNYVMTAAHCIRDDVLQMWGKFRIRVGKHKLMRRDDFEQTSLIKKVYMHEDYNPSMDQYDIALLELESPVNMTERVETVTLAISKFDMMSTDAMDCYATGFGIISSDIPKLANTLQELKTNFISKPTCRMRSKKLFDARSFITKLAICTQDVDSGVCNGDSGGPVGCYYNGKYIQIGILSWGSQNCPEGFNVFMRVSQFRQWIKNITGSRAMYMQPWEMDNLSDIA